MRELHNYDAAVAAVHTMSGLQPMPLVSWDFYMNNYRYINSFREDLRQLATLSKHWAFKRNYAREFTLDRSVIIVTSPKLEIVYASHNMTEMNGYEIGEVLGKTPKMFQGERTCLKTAAKIRKAVQQRIPFEEVILNYRKDQTVYDCRIKGFPVHNTRGKLVNYIAFEAVA